MPLSSMTAIPEIAEGSEATPGCFNARFSIISRNLAEINNLAIGPTGTAAVRGSGSPEGAIEAAVGIIYQDITATSDTTHWLWVKGVGSGNTGWQPNAGFAGSGVRSLHFGYGSAASAENAVAMGPGSVAGGSGAAAIGYQSQALLAGAAAHGLNARAVRDNDSAFGINSYVSGPGAGVFGSTNTSTVTGGYVLGANGQNSHQSSVLVTTNGGSSITEHSLYVDMKSYVSNFLEVRYGTQPRLVLHSTNSAAADATELLFQKGGNTYWRVGQNVGGANLDCLDLYGEQLGAAVLSARTDGRVSVTSRLNIATHTPATSTSTGVAGDIAWDSSFVYVCISASSWRRAAISGY